MSELDYSQVLRDLQYKPNFAYGVYQNKGWWMVRIIMLVEDARAPFRKWELTPLPQDREELWFGTAWFDQMPKPAKGVGYSPSREMMEVVGNYRIPYFEPGDEDTFVQWMISCFRAVEDHEFFEWARYKGELINDPHKD